MSTKFLVLPIEEDHAGKLPVGVQPKTERQVNASYVCWFMLHYYLESQIDLALGEDEPWKFRYRKIRTPDGGWWDVQKGAIPWPRDEHAHLCL